METITVKRNGVYIVFPKKEKAPIAGEIVETNRQKLPEIKITVKPSIPPYINRLDRKRAGFCKRQATVLHEKQCVKCGEKVYHNSSYCWDCYKYEYFESR